MSLSLRLRHRFADFALDLGFEAPAGVTALFGRSGAGKTSVVNAVAGLLRPDAGRIELDGRVLFDRDAGIDLPPHRRRIGYVFQEGRLFPHLNVRRNLLYGRWFAPARAVGEDFAVVVEMLGLGRLLDRRPGALSGGEKQRVAIGRALLSKPAMLLMDEPLAALDEARKQEILPYLERLRDEVAVPILYVSHSLAEVTRLATTLVLVEAGRLHRAGPTAEVLADPAAASVLGVREAGAVVAARLVAQHPDGLSELAVGGGALHLPRVAAPIGARMRVRIHAQDVMIALERPRDISALNILEGRIEAVHLGAGPGAMVRLRCGDEAILARLTRRSVAALDLRPGRECFAVVKSVAVSRGDLGPDLDAEGPA